TADAGDAPGAGARSPRSRATAPVWLALAVVLVWAGVHRMLVPSPVHPPAVGAAIGAAALVWAHLAWLTPWAPHSPLLPLWIVPAAPVAWAAWLGLAVVAAGGLVLA